MKKQALTALFLVVLTIGMASTALAETSDDKETSNVDVNVTAETALDVKPDQLTYNQVSVGDRVNVTDNSHGYETLKVENTGSNDIQRVWLSTSRSSTGPFGTGTAADHDSANMLQVKPSDTSVTGVSGDGSTYHYVSRVEYFESSTPLVDLGDYDTKWGNVSVGRARFGNNEFYVALGYDGSACTSGELRVADTPTTPTSLGTVSFDSGDSGSWTNYTIGGASESAEEVGIAQSAVSFALDGTVADLAGSETHNYDVLTQCSSFGGDGPQEEYFTMTRYDVEEGETSNLDGGDGSQAQEIFDTASAGEDLYPGEHFGIDMAVQVPRGVPNGDLTTGKLTVYSQAAP